MRRPGRVGWAGSFSQMGRTRPRSAAADHEAAARLQALGYVSGRASETGRPDPKDRRELAARIARVTSGEVHGAALERLLALPDNDLLDLVMGRTESPESELRDMVTKLRAA